MSNWKIDQTGQIISEEHKRMLESQRLEYIDTSKGIKGVSPTFTEIKDRNMFIGNCKNLTTKLPIGVMPRFVWELQRIEDLKKAIDRYTEAGYEVNPKWIEEYNELLAKYK